MNAIPLGRVGAARAGRRSIVPLAPPGAGAAGPSPGQSTGERAADGRCRSLTRREDADLLELGMGARAMKRWLWGLLLMGMVLWVVPGRVHGKASASAGSPLPAPVVVPQVHVPPFAAPASMPALGEELARALYAALRDAHIPARLGKGDEGSAIVGRLEELSQAQVRLHASYHGHSVQSVGDLEHLDDLVFAVFTQLRPRLQAAAPADGRSGALVPPASGTDLPAAASPDSAVPVTATLAASRSNAAAPSTTKTGTATKEKEAAKDAASASPIRLASVKDLGATPAHTARPSASSHHPAEAHPAAPTPAPVEKEPVVASAPSLPTPPMVPPEPTPSPEPPPRPPSLAPLPSKNPSTPRPPLAPFTLDSRRPRVAVHVVGDPLARIPAGYSGLGAIGQQSMIGYLQQRLRHSGGGEPPGGADRRPGRARSVAARRRPPHPHGASRLPAAGRFADGGADAGSHGRRLRRGNSVGAHPHRAAPRRKAAARPQRDVAADAGAAIGHPGAGLLAQPGLGHGLGRRRARRAAHRSAKQPWTY